MHIKRQVQYYKISLFIILSSSPAPLALFNCDDKARVWISDSNDITYTQDQEISLTDLQNLTAFGYGNYYKRNIKCYEQDALFLKIQPRLWEEAGGTEKNYDYDYITSQISNGLSAKPTRNNFAWTVVNQTHLRLAFNGDKIIAGCFTITNRPFIKAEDGVFLFGKEAYCKRKKTFTARVKNRVSYYGMQYKYNFTYKLVHDPASHNISLTNLSVRDNCDEIEEQLECRLDENLTNYTSTTIRFLKAKSFSINDTEYRNKTCRISGTSEKIFIR